MPGDEWQRQAHDFSVNEHASAHGQAQPHSPSVVAHHVWPAAARQVVALLRVWAWAHSATFHI